MIKVANTTKTKEKKVAVGVKAGGSVGFSVEQSFYRC